jgi:hypothetical protein
MGRGYDPSLMIPRRAIVHVRDAYDAIVHVREAYDAIVHMREAYDAIVHVIMARL